MGLFSKKQPEWPPPGTQLKSNGYVTYLTTDPGPHTCVFSGGQQISRWTVRLECDYCDATQDIPASGVV